MLTNYYTLKALVSEWERTLVGSFVADGYSQHKGSLILVFSDDGENEWSLNTSVQAPNRHMFLYAGSNRSRKNVVDVFPFLRNQVVTAVSLAERDRLVTMQFASGDRLYFVVYGPSANVYLERGSGEMVSFRGEDVRLPAPRPAPALPSSKEIQSTLASGASLKRLLPLFPPPLIQEVWHRVGGTEDPTFLASAIKQLDKELESPKGLIYWGPNRTPLLSVVELSHQTEASERFDTVNEAVRVCARRRLAITRFSGTYTPLLNTIQSRAEQARNSLQRVEEELQRPSRADEYEAAGHLIMAQPNAYNAGSSSIEVQDWLTGGELKRLSMDPKLTAIENAQRYYQKAKATRVSREKSVERLGSLRKTANDLHQLHQEALSLSTIEDVESFKKKHANRIQKLTTPTASTDAIPYRQYTLDGGYEVWVGRNARQNDQLTMKDARKFDLWLHARGVSGSHTVLRLNGKSDVPPKAIVEQAASIAAWHSKARPSALVPVIVVERKYVRKPRKALPGAVVVEREKVILVEPGLPDAD